MEKIQYIALKIVFNNNESSKIFFWTAMKYLFIKNRIRTRKTPNTDIFYVVIILPEPRDNQNFLILKSDYLIVMV